MGGLKHVTIYTDGACLGNPGAGGCGIVLRYGSHRKELSAGFRKTTNNRMEIMAAIIGLRALKEKCVVDLHSDSEYLVKAIEEGWAKRWQENGWRRNKKAAALNPDLWKVLLDLCGKHQVSFRWVKGHRGDEENERCDKLASAAAGGNDLLIDEEYESTNGPHRPRGGAANQ